MSPARQSALTVITRTIRIAARHTATTVRVGSRMGPLSAQAPGTAGDVHITDAATMVATLMADLRDAGLRDVVLRDMAGWSGAVSKDAAGANAFAVGSIEGFASVAEKLIPSSDLVI